MPKSKTKTSNKSKLRKFTKLHTKFTALVGILIFAAAGSAYMYFANAATANYTIYRMTNGTHSFYSAIEAEKKFLVETLGWKLVSQKQYSSPDASGPIHVHKLQNKADTSNWYFTTDQKIVNSMAASGWTYKGIAFLAASSKSIPYGYCRDDWHQLQSKKQPTLYRYVNTVAEIDSLVGSGQWLDQNVAFKTDYECKSNPAPSSNTSGDAISSTCDSKSLKKSNGSPWVCSFSDEFTSSTLNNEKWVAQITDGSGFATGYKNAPFPRACYVNTPKNISIKGGYLNLSATQESSSFVCKGATGGSFTTKYTAAQVMTHKRFSQQYGRFEIRAKLPSYSGEGLQETFWLWPNDQFKHGSWPGSGEIDMGEFYSKYADFNVPYTHYLYDKSSVDTASDRNIVTLGTPTYNKNYYGCRIKVGEFNTYTLIWLAGKIEISVNGKLCLVNNYAANNSKSPAPFDHPFFLALTQAIGTSGNTFKPGVTPLPATTQVDYVRIWK